MYQDIKNIYHLFVAILANIFYMFPGKKIKVIGVTGTDGKTTTVSLIHHILKISGRGASMLSSIGVKIENEEIDTGFHVTTPSPFALQRVLKKAVEEGNEYFVLEVTSHAIDQNRIFGIPFEIGILTNVSEEHLDYHKDFQKYVDVKEKFLLRSKIAIVNIDDPSFRLFKKIKEKKGIVTYGKGEDADIKADNLPVSYNLIKPDFNRENYLAAYAACKKIGLKEGEIKKAFSSFKMPKGRYDFVYSNDYSIVIDFAHTPNSIDKLLNALRKDTKNKLIHVFGSAGDRDRRKRKLMGQVSSKYADVIYLTSEDPRNEDPNQIMNEIEQGILRTVKVLKEEDRSLAVRNAISLAGPGDIVVITGKGHEKSMTYGKKDYPWDEYGEVKNALSKKLNHERN